MTSAHLAISFLKQPPLVEKQLRMFLSYLPQEPLKEYLSNANIYKGKRNIEKHDLTDIIITEKSIESRYKLEDDLTKEEAYEILKNSNFVRKENNISISSLEVKARPKPLNN